MYGLMSMSMSMRMRERMRMRMSIIVSGIDEDENLDGSKDGLVWVVKMVTYLVRFFCAELDIGSMDITVTYSPHSH